MEGLGASRPNANLQPTIHAILALGGSRHCIRWEWELWTGDYFESCGYVGIYLDGICEERVVLCTVSSRCVAMIYRELGLLGQVNVH